ncbi:MAG: HPr family phosphocarrier protein [Planctomycetes bacterium]|nr:HPr family phosphocarrier protein [Planctomycetota bacterium]
MPTDDTVRITVTILNRLGLHARPAMALVDAANRYQCKVTIQKHGSDEVHDGKSIMSVMMLAAGEGTRLEIQASGPDAKKAADALKQLVTSKFGEE